MKEPIRQCIDGDKLKLSRRLRKRSYYRHCMQNLPKKAKLDQVRHWRILSVMVIVETSIFSKFIQELMSDDQYKELQEALVVRPGMGDLIKGSGGLRKARWNLKGTGKSGGVRAVY